MRSIHLFKSFLSPSLSVYIYVYIYIDRERHSFVFVVMVFLNFIVIIIIVSESIFPSSGYGWHISKRRETPFLPPPTKYFGHQLCGFFHTKQFSTSQGHRLGALQFNCLNFIFSTIGEEFISFILCNTLQNIF